MVPTLCIIDTLIQKTGGYITPGAISGFRILQVPCTPGENLTPGDISGFRVDSPGPFTPRRTYHTWNYIRVQDRYSRYPLHQQRDIHPCVVVVQGSY